MIYAAYAACFIDEETALFTDLGEFKTRAAAEKAIRNFVPNFDEPIVLKGSIEFLDTPTEDDMVATCETEEGFVVNFHIDADEDF